MSSVSSAESLGALETYLRETLRSHPSISLWKMMLRLGDDLRERGIAMPQLTHTPYENTIAPEDQPEYPGDLQLERRIISLVRWNAMAMVVKANREHSGIGGHISTFASAATLYEVGQNHFFRGGEGDRPADYVFFQGHASPGMYARSYLEGRIEATQLHNFRQDLAPGGGLTSYPHPYIMSEYWQAPTVSMGLGPIMSIYQARFDRYLRARKLLESEELPRIWSFVGDGEMDEPESVAGIALAGREKLDNLTWVVNCNLQRLDGPVRGNGKIIQELEGIFRGAGWNVIKVIWGSDWDDLLAEDEDGLLRKRMEEAVDGDYQKYSVAPGSYTRKHFFGKYPELLDRVHHLKDRQIEKMLRGGHDPLKVYAAYRKAVERKGAPTVILAKTIKGYGLGEAGEGRNVTHQQKKLDEKELRYFRERFDIPISVEEVIDAPFFRPGDGTEEMKYLRRRREELGGYLPRRTSRADPLPTPKRDVFSSFLKGSGGSEASTTMAAVRMVGSMMKDREIGQRLVPIIPDEARTFGMDALFRQAGIYAPEGQKYEPVDRDNLLYYRESADGQIMEEGITEAGSLSTFCAAGASYARHGMEMVPCYFFYSMFGFQRVGDLIWAAGDLMARGFLFGATAGRTALNGEGLQHQDGHSLALASAYPNIAAYDPAFAYEVAVLIRHGMRRMFEEQDAVVYYLTLYNETYPMPEMPGGVEKGIARGLYRYREGSGKGKQGGQIFASGPAMLAALEAQELLESDFGISVDVWSATSYKALRSDAMKIERSNRMHPQEEPQRCYLQEILDGVEGPFVAVSDYIQLVPDQISRWMPEPMEILGTDGFGCSDTRERLRAHFETDAAHIALAVLDALKKRGTLKAKDVEEAMEKLGIDAEKAYPEFE